VASGLDPSVLSHRGLAAAIASLTARTPVPVSLSIPAERFPSLIESTAYFVVAEALANIGKYAAAGEASVTVAVEGEWLELEVSDDGCGGAVADPASGSGLAGLADRVAAVRGTLTVNSPAGGGTTVRARLPLSSAAAG
jgi:signal transduction histidine kinase